MPRERSSGRQTMPIEHSQGHQTAPQGECSLTVNAHCFPVKLSYIAYIAIYKGDTLKTISKYQMVPSSYQIAVLMKIIDY